MEELKNDNILDDISAEPSTSSFDEIAFMTKVLDKQFELVGVPYTTMEIIEMNQSQQMEIYQTYYMTDDILEKWFEEFIKITSEIDAFKNLDNDALKAIFESIVNEWGFNYEEDDEESEDVEDEEE